MIAREVLRALGTLGVVGAVVVGSFGVVAAQAGCSGGTCSSDEEASCSEKFSACVSAAVISAKKADCEACAKSYCDCYDSCGSDCNESDHKGTCDQIP
ncbi:MAG: hypothetical protein KIT84_00835 [Labilithrix sp.]|nr:hypothetical protein [Labilithrix sp.]MCW5809529.1 hypothetical protein [Labilithrix sp.]